MASNDLNENRIKFEVKKELMLSIRRDLKNEIQVETNLPKCRQCRTECPSENFLKFFRIYQCGTIICLDCLAINNGVNYPYKINGHNFRFNTNNIAEIVLDKICAELPTFCKNEKFGCKAILMAENMLEHENECLFRKINCPYLVCTETVTFLGLLNHLERSHIFSTKAKLYSTEFKITEKFSENWQNPFNIPVTQIIAFDKTFFRSWKYSRWYYVSMDLCFG